MKNPLLRTTNVSNTFKFAFGELVAVGIRKEAKEWKFDTKRELGIWVGQPDGQVDSHYMYFPYTDTILTRADVIGLNIPPEDLAAFYLSRANMKRGQSSYSEVAALARDINIASDFEPTPRRIIPWSDLPASPKRMATRKRPAAAEDVIAQRSVKSSDKTDVDVEHFGIKNPCDFDTDHFLETCASESDRKILEPVQKVRNLACGSTQRNPTSEEIQKARSGSPVPWTYGLLPSAPILQLPGQSSDGSEKITLNDEVTYTSDESNYHGPQPDCGQFYDVFARKIHNAENPTLGSALKGIEVPHWRGAIKSEVLENLLKPTDVSMKPVDWKSLPKDVLITYLTFVLKKKIKKDRLDRYKARGCTRGDLLKFGAVETYSPTVSSVTCAAMQQIAVIDEMNQALVDTVGAFLAQDYPDSLPPIYVKLPREVAEICGLDPDQVYQLVKYLYGIPDAGRAYYKAYRDLLLSRAYVQSQLDPCLFFAHVDGEVVYAWIHVDDTWVAASTPGLLQAFIKDVQSHFEVTVEDVDNYLGVHYQKLPDGSMRKTQPKLLNDLFETHNVKDRPLVRTPAIPQDRNLIRDSTPCDTTRFLSLVGVLLYVLFSRPDIGFAVSWGASKANTPTMADWCDLIRVVQYLYQTRDKGLIIRKQPKGCPLQMYIYVDASYLLYPDSKAQTGYCFSLNDIGTFYSKSQKQPLVTTSSSHSEIRAMFVAVCQYVFLEMLFDEIGRPLTPPAIVLEDNQPVCTLITREHAMPKMCKHFLMLVNYLREMIDEGKIEVRKIATEKNFSDIETKHVYGRDFLYKCQQILGHQEGEPIYEPVIPYKKPVVM
jgi:hypothetical protein